jgi:hypothetical protein
LKHGFTKSCAREQGSLFTMRIHGGGPLAGKPEEENRVAEADIVDMVQGGRDLRLLEVRGPFFSAVWRCARLCGLPFLVERERRWI